MRFLYCYALAIGIIHGILLTLFNAAMYLCNSTLPTWKENVCMYIVGYIILFIIHFDVVLEHEGDE